VSTKTFIAAEAASFSDEKAIGYRHRTAVNVTTNFSAGFNRYAKMGVSARIS